MIPVTLGIDLGGTHCRGGLVDADGSLRLRAAMPTAGPDAFYDRFSHFCRELLAQGRAKGFSIERVGVGVPGTVDRLGQVVTAPNLPELRGVALAPLLSRTLSLPVVITNDVDAIASAEARCGAGRDLDSFLVVALGTGVGGGLVLRRQVWRGVRTSTVELGHILAISGGRLCGCGHHGCLETYASGPGLARSVQLAIESGSPSILSGSVVPLTGAEVAAAARDGDAVALAAFAEAGLQLGRVLAGVVNLLGLDTVVFAGSVATSLDLLRPTLERACAEALFAGTPLPQLRPAALGDDAGIIGAAVAAGDC